MIKELPEWLEEIVVAGIQPYFCRVDEETVLALNTGAKSELYLKEGGLGWIAVGRYGKEYNMDDLKEAMYAFLDCYRMREFGNLNWLGLCVKHGLLKKKETVSYSYE